MRKPHYIAFAFLIGVLLLFVGSCKKEQDDDVVPYVPVNIQANLSLPSYVNLNVVGGYVYVTGGSRGIILYRKTQDAIMAYDRHCTYQVSEGCQMLVDTGTTQITDFGCCGSRYSIINGGVENGPASAPLRQYETSFDGTTLYVYN